MDEKFAIYGEGVLGVNMLKITSTKIEEPYSPSFKLSYVIGGGILINDKYSIGLSYYGLGLHKVKYEWKETYDGDIEKDDDKFEKALDLSLLSTTLGIKL